MTSSSTAGPARRPAPGPGSAPRPAPAPAPAASQPEPSPVLILNGPNLGRLGKREPAIYGTTTHAELAALCLQAGTELGLAVQVRQSDSEADLIGWLGEAADRKIPVILNPGGLAHTSIALRDAVTSRTAPLVEVHISNVHAREQFRHHSYVSGVSSGVIVGLGIEGYVLALSWLSAQLGE